MLITLFTIDLKSVIRGFVAAGKDKAQKILFFVITLFMLGGCGTITQLIDPTQKYEAYAGTEYDWKQARQWGLPILDLPLSFLLDTVLLPYVWSQE